MPEFLASCAPDNLVAFGGVNSLELIISVTKLVSNCHVTVGEPLILIFFYLVNGSPILTSELILTVEPKEEKPSA